MRITSKAGKTLFVLRDDMNGPEDRVLIDGEWHSLEDVYDDKRLLMAFNDELQAHKKKEKMMIGIRNDKEEQEKDLSVFSIDRRANG